VHAQVQAARADGYSTIWLGGISIGGFMALAYAAAYQPLAGGMIDGLCLLSPYPGNRLLLADIRRAGALANWRAPCAEGDDECRVWRWLQAHGKDGELPIYCGYGRQDRFADGQQMLAEALPPQQVDVIDGMHDWPAWRKLWNNFLDRAFAEGAPAMSRAK
jgi:pimeloyl-ACP methyl ester carboxylesterase